MEMASLTSVMPMAALCLVPKCCRATLASGSTQPAAVMRSLWPMITAPSCSAVLGKKMVASRSCVVEGLLAPLVGAVKAAPVASFVVLLLMWVPSRRLSVAVSFLMAFPIMYTNVLAGVRQTDPALLEMADVFGVRGWARACTIYAVQVAPYLRAGLSLAMGLSWKSGVAAEVIGLPALSIGIHLYDAKVYLDVPGLLAWTVVIVALSVGLEVLLGRLLDWAQTRWEARP